MARLYVGIITETNTFLSTESKLIMSQFNRKDSSYSLATEIYHHLSQGTTLTTDIIHYIQTTFGLSRPWEICQVILDDNNCEQESLLELIFFPDKEMQIALEKTLAKGQFGSSDHQDILHHLMDLNPEIPIYLESGEHLLTILLPENTASKFINRLYIHNHPDPYLISLIESLFPEKEQLTIRINLRHKTSSQNDDILNFLKQFFKIYSRSRDIFWEYFDFILNFLEELEKESDIFEALIKKRISLEETLLQAQRQEDLLRKQTMETLILQGQRILCLNPDTVKRSLEIIDDIAFRLFGHIFFDNLSSPHELDLEDNWTDFDRIFNLFRDDSSHY